MFGSGLKAEDLTEALDSASVETVPAGQAILTEGDAGDDIFVIRTGVDDR